MMNYKKLFVFSCFLIFLTLGFVSASDNIENGTFDDLSDDINQTTETGTLNLVKDYKWTVESDSGNTDGVKINKSITINGKGHTIDANNKSRIFTIESDNVCIKDINFINANANGSGGAVFVKGNNIQIINCNFTNSNSKITGAAVTFIGENLTVTDSSFINGNVIKGDFSKRYNNNPAATQSGSSGGAVIIGSNPYYGLGGAIYFEGKNVVVRNSLFKDNVAYDNGGAIFAWKGFNLTIIESVFSNNKKIDGKYKYNDIYSSVNTTIINSTIAHKDNIRCDKLTVIYSDIPSDIEGSFGELYKKINEAGDILVLDKDYTYIDGDIRGIPITKPITIIGNGYVINASKLSRAFNIASDNVTLINIKFINGMSYDDYFVKSPIGGGAIYWSGNNAKIINCTFENNEATGYYPRHYESKTYPEDGMGTSVIPYDPGTGAITNWAGAVYLVGNNAQVLSTSFKNNYAEGYSGAVGALGFKGNDCTISNCEFIKGIGRESQAFDCRGSGLTVNATSIYHNFDNIYDNEFYGGSNAKYCNLVEYYSKTNKTTNITTYTYHDLTNSSNNGTLNNPTHVGIMSEVFGVDVNTPGIYYPSSIELGDEIIFDYLSTGNTTVSVSGGSVGDIIVVDHPEAVITCENGIISVSNLTAGEYTLKVISIPDENHTEVIKTLNITVKKASADLKVSVDEVYEGDNITVIVKANTLINGNVTLKINNTEKNITLVNGVGNITLSNYVAGKYPLNITFSGDENFNEAEIESVAVVKVNPVNPTLTISVENIEEGESAVVKITTNASFTGAVSVRIDSKLYSVNVVNGVGSISVSSLKVGNHVAQAEFKATEFFTSSVKTATFNVAKKEDVVTLTLKKVTVKKSAKKLTLQATLKINGKAVKGKKITFKFNGKKLTTKTNSKGVSKVTVSKSILKKLKVGKKVTYTATYGKTTTKVSVKVKK